MEQSVKCLAGETEILGENLLKCRIVHHKIPHYLTRDRTRAAAVGNRRLTARAAARIDCRLNQPANKYMCASVNRLCVVLDCERKERTIRLINDHELLIYVSDD
jgi:hypothetical protein